MTVHRALKSIGLFLVASCVAASAGAIGLGGSSAPAKKMIVGDSIFALSGDIHSFLEADLNRNIDTYARSGCQMNGGNMICSADYSVPKQYENASKRRIKTVIMNGGANDFLFGAGAACETQACIEEVLLGIEQTIGGMVASMKSDGIEEILYLGYYNLGDPANDMINAASMGYKAAVYPSMGVKFVDTRAAFAGNEGEYIGADGLHPTTAGSRALADLILQQLN